jgi:hypothetical protein
MDTTYTSGEARAAALIESLRERGELTMTKASAAGFELIAQQPMVRLQQRRQLRAELSQYQTSIAFRQREVDSL